MIGQIPGRGTTIDVILANGELNRGDEIVVCGMNGEAIVTRVKALLTPPPMSELRVKSEYVSHDKVRASIGCKIDANGLDEAVSGSPLFVINPGDSEEVIEGYKNEVSKCLSSLQDKIDRSGVGVYVQASTLGSMEALLEFLHEDCKIPVFGIRIGPVHKKDVIRASTMLEHKREYAVILAFDVTVTKEAKQEAAQLGVKIFEADVIYHLEQMFQKYIEDLQTEGKERAKDVAVFPCILTIIPEYVFHKRSPLVFGVHVDSGIVKIGTPMVIPGKEFLELGKITKIERDHKTLEEAREGEDVCVEITQSEDKQQYMFGRQFDHEDELYSKITRESLDALRDWFPEVCKEKEIYKLLLKLKKVFSIL
eukprot:TRINITY_DN3473_c0_g2_i12.p1 TRINITY_DN3473_c0_g2~~TRINITY_DN3473_c0_g2_i12.p1  ORF type:complete len:366 (-),score=97.10 TRINITY_DN3473_c0_g2_i12:106-1203(-)